MILVSPRFFWRDGALETDVSVEFDGGAIRSIRRSRDSDVPDCRPHLLMPAPCDLQVNGAGGVMFNSDPSAQAIAAIVEAERARGTGWVMPTLITTTLAAMERAADAAIEAWNLPGFAGLHLEGPHINQSRKGTHRPEFIRPFEPESLAIVRRLRKAGIPLLITLAPECVPTAIIRQLTDLGAVVSAGHSEASACEAMAGIEAGVTCFTHLFNAMPAMQSRAPGIVGAAIRSDAFVGIIADGHHVDWSMIAIACAARPQPGRMFLVSDAMATIGGPDHFDLYGERIVLRDGRLVNAAGALAGAHIDMATGLRNLIRHVGLDKRVAIAMACDTPWRAMGLVPPALEPGRTQVECLALDEDYRPVALT